MTMSLTEFITKVRQLAGSKDAKLYIDADGWNGLDLGDENVLFYYDEDDLIAGVEELIENC